MLPGAAVGLFTLFVLVGFIIKDLYEGYRFEHSMDAIQQTPLIVLGRFAFYALYAEMGIFGIVLLLDPASFPFYYALIFHPPFEELIELVGMALMAAGLAVAFWSIRQVQGRKLALTGPYRYVRHPIYLSCSMIAIGFFLAVLNLMALAPLLIIPAQARMADAEEEILVQRFGGQYAEYQRRTGKMFPRVRRSR
jgi:protein-S-isoprenylcysteine O-methyltransferase Ste14